MRKAHLVRPEALRSSWRGCCYHYLRAFSSVFNSFKWFVMLSRYFKCFRVSSNVLKRFRAFWSIFRYFWSVFEYFPKSSSVFAGVFERWALRAFSSVFEYSKLFSSIFKCFKRFQIFSGIFERSPACSRIFKRVEAFSSAQKHFQACWSASSVLKYFQIVSHIF